MSEFDDLVKEGDEFFENYEYNKAIDKYGIAIEKNPYDIQIHEKLGKAFLKIKNYDKAIEFYLGAIKTNPKCSHNLYFDLGYCYYSLNEYDGAVEYFKKAVELNPYFDNGYFNMGKAYSEKKDYDNAIICHNKAVEINDKKPEYYFERGYVLECKNKNNEALANYEKAIDLNTNYIRAYFYKSALLYELDRDDEALDILSNVSTNDPGVHYIKGRIYTVKGNFELAINSFEKCFDVFKKDYIVNRIVKLCNQYNELEKASEIFNKFQNDPYSNYGLGKIELLSDSKDKDYSNVINYFKKVLELMDKTDSFDDDAFIIFEYLVSYLNKNSDEKILLPILENVYPILELVKNFKEKQSSMHKYSFMHYTKPGSLESLVKNKTHFRLSNVNNMNDPEEGKTLLKYLKENKIDGICEKYPLNDFYDDIDGIDFQTTFVGSFLKEEDNLYLWRTYGKDSKKEEAKGMCICIKNKFFQRWTKNSCNSLRDYDEKNNNQPFSPIIYDVLYCTEKDLNEKIVPLLKDIETYLSKLKQISSEDNGKHRSIISTIVRSIMDEVLYLIKSSNYKEEKESRVLVTCGINHPKIKYDTEGDFPYKLYLEIEKPFLEHIEKIVLGPRVEDCDRWKLYLNREGIPVKESNCSYR